LAAGTGNRVNQFCRDLVTVIRQCLGSVWADRHRVISIIALEGRAAWYRRGIRLDNTIRVVEDLAGDRVSEQIILEISLSHFLRGHKSDEGDSMSLAFRLVIGEEERLVLDDRATQCAPKLIQIELFF